MVEMRCDFKRVDNVPAHTRMLTVGGMRVGKIDITETNQYMAQTHGRVAAIDGLTGSSPEDVWQQIVDMIKDGKVWLAQPIDASAEDR